MDQNTFLKRATGQTKNVGFQIGVRRTFAVSPQRAWEILTSAEGIKLWLGDVPGLRLEQGALYKTRDGVQGEIRVVNPGGHFRLTWRAKGREKASTIQVRIIPNAGRTTISFHQENLLDQAEREQMRQRWQSVLGEIETLVSSAE